MKGLILYIKQMLKIDSAKEAKSLHLDLRRKVHEGRNIAQQALGTSFRANRLSREAIRTAEGAIRLLEEARQERQGR